MRGGDLVLYTPHIFRYDNVNKIIRHPPLGMICGTKSVAAGVAPAPASFPGSKLFLHLFVYLKWSSICISSDSSGCPECGIPGKTGIVRWGATETRITSTKVWMRNKKNRRWQEKHFPAVGKRHALTGGC
jgi:hypothetical protein